MFSDHDKKIELSPTNLRIFVDFACLRPRPGWNIDS
jgi:hypothetical protein